MKQKSFLITILLIGIIFSYSTNKSPKKIEFLFVFPTYQTKFTIDIENKTIEQYSTQIRYRIYIKNKANQIEDPSKDTLIIHYKKTFKINEENLQDFINKIELSQFNKTLKHGNESMNGVDLTISKIDTKNDTISLTTSNPVRNNNYKTDYGILDAFFKLSYKTINDYKGICNLEKIQDHFNYGLPIRLVSKHPLEYRIWGTISDSRENNLELITFLNKLHNNKLVIFDLRNGFIAPSFYEILCDFSKKKKMFFYGKDESLEDKAEIEKLKIAIEDAKKNDIDYSILQLQLERSQFYYKDSKYLNELLNKNIKLYNSKEEILKNCR